jgi:multidrug efflux pump subunit AcrB
MTSRSAIGTTCIVLQFDFSRNIHDAQAGIKAARADLPSNLPTMARGQMYDVGEQHLGAALRAAPASSATSSLAGQRLLRFVSHSNRR